jgi:predicted metalloprotease with PDZ domain
MLLDLEIINDSKGAHSLDDVMKYMYNTYYKAKGRGYTDAEFKEGLEKFAGKNLDGFYKNYVYGVTPIDNNKYLGYAGYNVSDELAGTNNATIGITFIPGISPKIVETVLRGTAGWIDGINVNDEVKAIDGNPVTDIATMLSGKRPGDKISVSVIRDGLPLILPVTLLKNTNVKYKINSLPNPTPQQMVVRKKWLGM